MSKLYRKSALEKLSSPEQLDKMIVITPLSVWIAIVAGIFLLAAVILWGITGSIPVLISCQGYYFNMGPIQSIYTEENGFIRECRVEKGDNVEKGDVLMVIEDTEGNLQKIRAKEDAAVYSVPQDEGSYLNVGQKILQYRATNEEKDGYVYCFVPLDDARKIQEGMKVMVYPEYLNTREYGHITGKVTEISRFIMDRGELEKYSVSEEKISKVLAGESLIGVRCELEKDPDSVNGYHWSSEEGASLEMISGTPVVAEVMIDSVTPASLLLQ